MRKNKGSGVFFLAYLANKDSRPLLSDPLLSDPAPFVPRAVPGLPGFELRDVGFQAGHQRLLVLLSGQFQGRLRGRRCLRELAQLSLGGGERTEHLG